jgi:hypothetical protein
MLPCLLEDHEARGLLGASWVKVRMERVQVRQQQTEQEEEQKQQTRELLLGQAG